MKRFRTAAVVTAATAVCLLATAAPGAAGSSDARTAHAFTWSATGGVDGKLLSDAADPSPMGLLDHDDPTRSDVAWATPVTSAERITVTAGDRTYACDTDRTHYYAGLTVLGNSGDWAGMPDGGSMNGRVRVNCTVGGTVHHFHWAEHKTAAGKWSASSTPDCVTISRSGDVFTVTATGCVVQHEVVSWKPGKQLSTASTTADVSAVLTRGAVLQGR